MSTYTTARDNIKSGDLLAWSTRRVSVLGDLFGLGIRFFMSTDYDHTGIAWVKGGRVFVIEAVRNGGVRIYPLQKALPFYHIPMDVDFNDSAETYLLSKIGEEYSIWQAIKSYFTKPDKDNSWQCAELCNRFYEFVGKPLGDCFTPRDIVRAALEKSQHGMELITIG